MRKSTCISVMASLLLAICAAGANEPPVLTGQPIVTPASAIVGQAVEITGVTAQDPEGQQVTISYEWGDNFVTSTGGSDFNINPGRHSYYYPGSYTVLIKLSDGINSVLGASVPITVAPASGSNQPPTTAGTSGPQIGCVFELDVNGNAAVGGTPSANYPAYVGLPVSVSVTATDPDQDIITVTFHWGDGTSSQSGGSLDNRSSHIYTEPGTYTISLELSDGINPPVLVQDDKLTIPVAAYPLAGAQMNLSVQALAGKIDFTTSGKDQLKFSGTLKNLPVGILWPNSEFKLSIGDFFIMVSYLNQRRGSVSCSAKINTQKNSAGIALFAGGDIPFKLKLSKATLAERLTSLGITPTLTSNGTKITVPVTAIYKGLQASATVSVELTSKAGKGARFQFKQ